MNQHGWSPPILKKKQQPWRVIRGQDASRPQSQARLTLTSWKCLVFKSTMHVARGFAPMQVCQHPPCIMQCYADLQTIALWYIVFVDLFMMFDVLRRRISLPQSCERSLTSLCGRLSESAEVFRDGGIVCPCSSFVMQRQDVYCSLLFFWAHLVAPSVKGHGTTTECCSLPRGTIGTSTGHWAELVINSMLVGAHIDCP